MNFYDVLEELIRDSSMGEDKKSASREIIMQLRGINAFGNVIASTESQTQVSGHVHVPMTAHYRYDSNKYIEICKECKAELGEPYLPSVNYYPGYRGQRYY